MPEAVPRELMVLAERVVRPLAIPAARSRRVRNELLQHLQTIYAQELALDNDPLTAIVRTQQRFGDSAELTAELQGTVRRWEGCQIWAERILAQDPAEALVRYVVRLTCVMTSPMVLWIAFNMTDHHFFGTVRYSIRDIGVAAAVVAGLSAWLGCFLMCGLQTGIEWERPQRRWSRIACLSLGQLGTWPISLMTVLLIAGGAWSDYSVPLIAAFVCGGFSVVAGGILGVRHRRDRLDCQKWTELDLDSA